MSITDTVTLPGAVLGFRLEHLKEISYALSGIERAMYNDESGEWGGPNDYVQGGLRNAIKVLVRGLDSNIEDVAKMAGLKGFEQ